MKNPSRILVFCLIVITLLPLNACALAGEPLYAIRDTNGLWGYIDNQGTLVIPGTFTNAEDFRGSYAIACQYPEGFVLLEGEEIDPLYKLDNGEYMKYTGLEGIIDASGKWVVDPEWFSIMSGDEGPDFWGGCDEGVYWLYRGNKNGFFDILSGFFSGAIYDDVFFGLGETDTELIGVVMDGKAGFVRRSTGETVIPFRYAPSPGAYFCGDWCLVTSLENPEQKIIIDRQGRETPVPDQLMPSSDRFYDGLLLIRDRSTGLYGYLDTEGRITIEPQFTEAYTFSEERAVVQTQDGNWALISRDGAFHYISSEEPAWYFCEHGLIPWFTSVKDSILFLNRDGAEAFTLRIEGLNGIGSFKENGTAWYFIRTDSPEAEPYGMESAGLFNDKGKILTPPVFLTNEETMDLEFSDSLLPVTELATLKSGYVDERGQWVIQPVNGYCQPFREELAKIDMDGDTGRYVIIIDRQGNRVYEYSFGDPDSEYDDSVPPKNFR